MLGGGFAGLLIIAMTANAFEAGMNAHLGKPIDVEKLTAVLMLHCGVRE